MNVCMEALGTHWTNHSKQYPEQRLTQAYRSNMNVCMEALGTHCNLQPE
ncbi:unnamed protein product [Callosobruchus maculatus]|uniref:Uncharacterized protein n=1 Tax=Callosobruchus maculatus TaxID=64391 RepID=A0A653DVH0_CALMS|nr:unnamed protein product [Callosobruchus maculatus]